VKDQHSLAQRDLLDIFGSPGATSQVLRGKPNLSKEHIRKLAAPALNP
jgi:antitoxin component HigA of HigAB toxin-antitoxin module